MNTGDWMKKFAVAMLLAGGTAFAGSAVVPTPPTSQHPSMQSFTTSSPSSVALVADGGACTAAGGATCTTILAATDVHVWSKLTVTIMNSGANTVENVLIEVSPDGTNWVILDSTSCANLGAGLLCTKNIVGPYVKIRVEARASANSNGKVWLNGSRP